MSDLQHKHHHHHSEEHKREVSNRLARAIGHLQKVKQMVEDDEDCSDVLIQLAAVKSAINNTGKVILKLLQDTCRVDGMTVILVTHNSAIAPMADRVIKIKNSRVEDIIRNDHPTPVEEIEW